VAAALVVDTSVLVKWFKTAGEELTAEAAALREHVDRTRATVFAPALLCYEVANILVRKADLGTAEAAALLETMSRWPIHLAGPEPELLHRGARLARDYDITFYDAAFVALAEALGCPLVTADRRLAAATRSLGFVVHLADVER
jgi:predicted nucleic acid-binding protein